MFDINIRANKNSIMPESGTIENALAIDKIQQFDLYIFFISLKLFTPPT